MNTRLQVEHPVTELVTGIDLVEQMILSADNKKLAIRQEDIKLNGWSVESRIYAEDPTKDFLPSIGRVTRYIEPKKIEKDYEVIRNDTGISPGSEVSLYYDPMISKLAVHSKDRISAINLMINSLQNYYLSGLENNIDFLMRDCIKNIMVADVPIGAFLSGGIDSSIVVSIMQSLSSNKIKTYTLGFQESEYDESIYAKRIANFLNSKFIFFLCA